MISRIREIFASLWRGERKINTDVPIGTYVMHCEWALVENPAPGDVVMIDSPASAYHGWVGIAGQSGKVGEEMVTILEMGERYSPVSSHLLVVLQSVWEKS